LGWPKADTVGGYPPAHPLSLVRTESSLISQLQIAAVSSEWRCRVKRCWFLFGFKCSPLNGGSGGTPQPFIAWVPAGSDTSAVGLQLYQFSQGILAQLAALSVAAQLPSLPNFGCWEMQGITRTANCFILHMLFFFKHFCPRIPNSFLKLNVFLSFCVKVQLLMLQPRKAEEKEFSSVFSHLFSLEAKLCRRTDALKEKCDPFM